MGLRVRLAGGGCAFPRAARYRIGLAGIGWDRSGDRSYGNCLNEEANVEMGIGPFLETMTFMEITRTGVALSCQIVYEMRA